VIVILVAIPGNSRAGVDKRTQFFCLCPWAGVDNNHRKILCLEREAPKQSKNKLQTDGPHNGKRRPMERGQRLLESCRDQHS